MHDDELLALAKARRHFLPYACLENRLLEMEVGQDLDRLVPRDFAYEKAVLPLFRAGSTLAIASPDCDDEGLLQELEARTGMKLVTFVAPRGQVMQVIRESYRRRFPTRPSNS